jgi:hypothetical protein
MINDGGALFRRLCASNAAALPKRDSYVSAMHVQAEGQAEAEIGNVKFVEALVRLSAAMCESPLTICPQQYSSTCAHSELVGGTVIAWHFVRWRSSVLSALRSDCGRPSLSPSLSIHTIPTSCIDIYIYIYVCVQP